MSGTLFQCRHPNGPGCENSTPDGPCCGQTVADSSLFTDADRIAADFAEIPFDDHEAKILALAYLGLRRRERCEVLDPTGEFHCDLPCLHDGKHVSVESVEWRDRG